MDPVVQMLLTILAPPGFGILGAWIAYRATKGKTQSDSQTARETRMDTRMEKYTSRIEAENEKTRKENEEIRAKQAEQDKKIEEMGTALNAFSHRERSLFVYITQLRNHVVKELPPPPPTIPNELLEWFEDLESTFPRSGPT